MEAGSRSESWSKPDLNSDQNSKYLSKNPKEDIERLERVGFSREEFTVTGEDGLTGLRNVGQWCYFYNPAEKKCQVYEYRPLGCFIYPVIDSIDEGVIVDELCPTRHTVSKCELKMKGKILLKHLKKITSDDSISGFKSYKFGKG